MAAPTEEADSTGVVVVNASDFLLLCLCLAAAISLWKLLVRRRREREHHEVKRKGSYQASNLRRSQSPPLPREQPKPKTKPRTTIVFDEWDGAPRPLSPLSRHLNECFYLFISPRKAFMHRNHYAVSSTPQITCRQHPRRRAGRAPRRVLSLMLHHPTSTPHAAQAPTSSCAA